MSKTPLPSGISPGTRAVISAAEELTMQVRRIADALSTPTAIIRDGVLTPLNTATTPTEGTRCVCGDPIEWWTGPGESAGWVHSPGAGTYNLDVHKPRPLAPPLAPDDVTCRRMETRTCPPSYGRPCGERPCARFESDDPTPWLDTAADEASYYRQLSAEQGQALSRAEASRAEAQRDRDQHAAVLNEVLAAFVHKVEGYRIPRRSAEADVATLEKWRSVVAPTVERPWWETVAELRTDLDQARAAIERVRATTAHMRSVTRTWDPAADLVDAALDESRQAPAEVAHPETNPQASGPHTVDEQSSPACQDVQQPTTEVQS